MLITGASRAEKLMSGHADDQSRVMTPQAAMQAGADYLVIGRPVTQAVDPLQALLDINREIGVAMNYGVQA